MKRAARFFLAVLVLLAITWLAGPKLAARYAGSAGTDLAGLPFSVGNLSVNPFSGRATITTAELQSEAPFVAPFVARVGQITARFEPGTLASAFVVIQEVVIDGAQITVEQQGTRLNVRDLAERVSDYASSADTTSAIRVFIRELRITNARGTLVTDLGEREFSIEDLVLRDVGSSERGTPIPIIVANLIDPVLERTLAGAGLPLSEGIGGVLKRFWRR